MKNFLFLLGGICAAAAAFAAFGTKRSKPVEVLAHDLEAAWADHRTVV